MTIDSEGSEIKTWFDLLQVHFIPSLYICVLIIQAFFNHQIRKVVKAYTPQVGDELELIDGDYIFLDPKELNKTKDGWYPGVSWLTGVLGMFPGVYTQKTAETWTWALHR
jgi:hypothetical protein